MYNINKDLQETVTLSQCIDIIAQRQADVIVDTKRGDLDLVEEEVPQVETLRGMVIALFHLDFVEDALDEEIEKRAQIMALEDH